MTRLEEINTQRLKELIDSIWRSESNEDPFDQLRELATACEAFMARIAALEAAAGKAKERLFLLHGRGEESDYPNAESGCPDCEAMETLASALRPDSETEG